MKPSNELLKLAAARIIVKEAQLEALMGLLGGGGSNLLGGLLGSMGGGGMGGLVGSLLPLVPKIIEAFKGMSLGGTNSPFTALGTNTPNPAGQPLEAIPRDVMRAQRLGWYGNQ